MGYPRNLYKTTPRVMIALWILLTGLVLPFSSAVGATCEDQAGRRMVVPDTPKRVVALAPSITEIIFSLGRQDRLVGVTQFSDYPPEAQQLPKVGTYVHLDLEKIVSLTPDLCIAVKDGNPVDVVRRLEDIGIPVYAVDPRGFSSVMDAVARIGRVMNAVDEAGRLVVDMKQRIERVSTLAAKAAHQPRVFFQIGISPIVAVGSGTFINELIVTAGGKNLSAGATAYPRYSTEQVLALSPEVLIITSMTRGGMFDKVKAQWESWPQMPAVQNHRIHVVDSDLFDRPTPRMVAALEYLFALIHPDLNKVE
jgi:iron complex transport system substrate-binding protein